MTRTANRPATAFQGRWRNPQPGDQAVPTALTLDDIHVERTIGGSDQPFARWLSEDALAACCAVGEQFGHPFDRILRGVAPWSADGDGASRGRAHPEEWKPEWGPAPKLKKRDHVRKPTRGQVLHRMGMRLAELGVVKISLGSAEISLYGAPAQLTQQDCITGILRSPFHDWTRLETSNRRVLVAFKVGENQAISFFDSGPVVRIDLWRGDSVPLSRLDRGGFLTVDDALAFAHRRFQT